MRDVPRAREWGERIFPEVKKAGLAFLEGFLRRPLAIIYVLSGEVSKAEEACQAVKRIEDEILTGCIFEDAASIGFHYLRLGEWDRAREYLEWAIPTHQGRNKMAAVSFCSFFLGILHLEQKNYSQAEKHLLRSLDICQEGGNVIFELWVLPAICELYLKMGEPEKTAEYIERGFDLLKPDQNWYGLPALMYLAKGMLATEQKDWDTAVDFFGKAIHINRQYQLPWDEAKVSYEWGLMHLTRDQAGDREIAREKLEWSLEIFQRIGAKKDVEKVLEGKKVMETSRFQ